MYKTISNCITGRFVKRKLIPEDKKEIYAYGFEIITSTIMYALIFILCAVITSTFWTSIIFLIGFYFVRKFCGGFHASTYLKCHMMSALNHFIVIAMFLFFPDSLHQLFNIIVLYICSIMIMLFAPVDHKNKRFTKNELRHFRLMSCIYSGIVFVVATLNIFDVFGFINANLYVFAFTLGTLSATISLLGAKIINLNERSNNT